MSSLAINIEDRVAVHDELESFDVVDPVHPVEGPMQRLASEAALTGFGAVIGTHLDGRTGTVVGGAAALYAARRIARRA